MFQLTMFTSRESRIDNRLAALKAHWSYQDVLLLGLALLPKGHNRLTADKIIWHQIVDGIKNKYKEVVPELLAKIHFEHRPGSPLTVSS